MSTRRAISGLFAVAALYDGILGIAFLFAHGAVYRWYDVPPPNHPGYVQFPAALLIVFGIMFLAIAMEPVKNRNLVPFGVLLKIAYCGVVAVHWVATGLPNMWKPFFFIDLVFLIAFAWAWTALGKESTPTLAS